MNLTFRSRHDSVCTMDDATTEGLSSPETGTSERVFLMLVLIGQQIIRPDCFA